MNLEELKAKVRPFCVANGIEMLAVFGSFARGEDTPASDIDLIARFDRPIGMFELIGIEQKLVKILGRPVDLGTEASLHPLIRPKVQNDLAVIYGT